MDSKELRTSQSIASTTFSSGVGFLKRAKYISCGLFRIQNVYFIGREAQWIQNFCQLRVGDEYYVVQMASVASVNIDADYSTGKLKKRRN